MTAGRGAFNRGQCQLSGDSEICGGATAKGSRPKQGGLGAQKCAQSLISAAEKCSGGEQSDPGCCAASALACTRRSDPGPSGEGGGGRKGEFHS
jgi:hypothetical protein